MSVCQLTGVIVENLEEVLELVRRVLTGETTRDVLIASGTPYASRQKAYVAVGLIIAEGSMVTETDQGYRVEASYTQLMDQLLAAGTGDQTEFPPRGRRSGDYFVEVARREKLHRTFDKKRAHLTPPPDLLELVLQHRSDPAVKAFFKAGLSASEKEIQRAREFRQKLGLPD